ncbi:MAG: acetyl-CoA carboxylase [Granulosicoccus sp.]
MAIEKILAMMPGVFYRKPSPDEPNFINEGDAIKKGDVIGLIEVMKTFHPVASNYSGTLTSFKVEESDAIAPGAVLALIET